MSAITKVFFRVDGNVEIGLGHIARCISVANFMTAKGWECYFLCRQDRFQGIEHLKRNTNFPVTVIRVQDKKSEIDYLKTYFLNHPTEVLIIDLLENNAEYIKAVVPSSTLVASFFDAAELSPLKKGLVFNHHPLCKPPQDNQAQYFLGPNYFILDKAFIPFLKQKRAYKKRPIKRIFINQGGADPFNLTSKIIRALYKLDEKYEVIVILGGAFDYHKELKQALTHSPREFIIKEKVSPFEMAEIMKHSDVAITAAGNCLYELFALGVPCITICHHKKHNQVAQFFSEKEIVVNLGLGTELKAEIILKTTLDLINNPEQLTTMSQTSKKIVDGKGVEKICQQINQNLSHH